MNVRKPLFGFVLAGLLIVGYATRSSLMDLADRWSRPPLPSAMPYSPTSTPTPIPVVSIQPSPAQPMQVNLDIPFTSQAPHKIWDADHDEFCEEASALMAVSYLKGDNSITNPDIADMHLYRIKDWEMQHFGYFEDTTAAETARILREHLGVARVQLAYNPTEIQLKGWLAQGKAILLPVAGRELGNPNFTGAGPDYHMIVLKGYNADGMFITHDPGTRKGANYLYSVPVIMNAIHDWNPANVNAGAKVVIIVG